MALDRTFVTVTSPSGRYAKNFCIPSTVGLKKRKKLSSASYISDLLSLEREGEFCPPTYMNP